MMKLKTLLYIGFLSSSMMQMYAQTPPSAVVTANKKHEKMAYIDAVKIYEIVASKGYKSIDMLQKLGNSYYFNANLEKAGKWYGELFAMNQTVDPEYYFRFAECLKAVGDYTKADAMMAEFNAKSGNDARAKLYESQKNYLEVIKYNSGRYNIEDAGINSDKRDYGSAINGNTFVFATDRTNKGVSNKKIQLTNESFTDLFGADVQADGKLGKPTQLNRELNSKYNESTPIYTKDGQTMYFTRNNYNDGKRKADKENATLLKLYVATKKGENWNNVKELPFNSDQYSTAHPALSPDEKTLYFASNMPGTLGQSDLWKVSINSFCSYGIPENLGTTINTPGRETFPFVSENNELYFATDGRPGLGGLDVVVSQLTKDGASEPVNVGAPINDSTDDFGFIIDNKTRSGYFTSDRLGGHGSDDIYRFTENKKLVCEQVILGVVTDKKTGELLPNSELTIFDSNMQEVKKITADQKGNYQFFVNCSKTYYVRASKPGYETTESKIDIVNQNEKSNLTMLMDKKIITVKKEDDIAKAMNIKMIYFDLDKSYIRPDAALELEKILVVMEVNPTMTINIRSHTDCRQTAAYNAALSGLRAKSTLEWLVSKGIKRSRLSSKGYGESQLTNACPCEPTNVSSCTEEEHQLNRRSEFIITSI